MKNYLFCILFLLVSCFALGALGSASPESAKNSLICISFWALLSFVFLPKVRVWFPLPLLGICIVVGILSYGWVTTANARSGYSFLDFTFTDVGARFWPGGPGSVTKEASIARMLEITGLFLVFVAGVRARESREWIKLLGILPILGVLVTLVGIYHRVVQAPSVWFVDEIHPPTFFAPFVYNAHAGAFLNLTAAIAFSFWVSSLGGQKATGKIIWGILTLVCISGAFASASKGAALIAFFTLTFSVIANHKRLKSVFLAWFYAERKASLEPILIFLTTAFVGVGLLVVGIQPLLVRMNEFIEDASDGEAGTISGRQGIMKVMLYMARPDEGGMTGFGPGSFPIVVPYFLSDSNLFVPGRWLNGHSDPLQLIVEWGYLGFALWLLLGLGALISGFRYLRANERDSFSRVLTRGMVVAVLALCVHSCFDFPFGILSIKFFTMLMLGMLWAGRPAEAAPRTI